MTIDKAGQGYLQMKKGEGKTFEKEVGKEVKDSQNAEEVKKRNFFIFLILSL